MRQKAADQTTKKNFILYKGHTGWKIKTRIFGTLLVSLSAVAIAETIGTADVHAATTTPDAPVADKESKPAAEQGNAATLSASKATTPTVQAAPVAASADVSTEGAAGAATDTSSDKQYQTLTPDQPMTVGKTDGSGVTLSGSQVQDHFTNTVQNFANTSSTDPDVQQGDLGKNITEPAADENGVWHLTSKDGHDFTSKSGFTMHNNAGPQTAHVSFENDIDFGHDFTLTGALGIGTKTSGGADGIGIVFAPGDPAYATTGKVGGNLGVGGLDNAFAFVYE
ncbi:lectin-like domain-containing protein [Levilactobacillus humaensis]|uniref:lectin-like domain-containing protein n=1 Tax=Levilactobacillus humaensis TaxID=2950375 RepID=UPI0021C42525|nr:hypothetical protein [Levilactobacillus humaensis]